MQLFLLKDIVEQHTEIIEDFAAVITSVAIQELGNYNSQLLGVVVSELLVSHWLQTTALQN